MFIFKKKKKTKKKEEKSNLPILSSHIFHRMKFYINAKKNIEKQYSLQIVAPYKWQLAIKMSLCALCDSKQIWIVIKRHLCKNRNATKSFLTHSIFESMRRVRKKNVYICLLYLFYSENHWIKKKVETKKENKCELMWISGFQILLYIWSFDALKFKQKKTHAYGSCAYRQCAYVHAYGVFCVHNAQ